MTVLGAPTGSLGALLRRPAPWICGALAALIAAFAAPHDAASAAVIVTAGVTAFLAVIDVQTHRLPNVIVLPLGACVFVCLVLAALITASWTSLAGAIVGGVCLGVTYLVLALIKAGGMGGGDVKLAIVLGMTGSWYGLHAWTWVFFAPFFIGGLLALVGLSVRRLTWTAQMPFGPALAIGYLMAAILAF